MTLYTNGPMTHCGQGPTKLDKIENIQTGVDKVAQQESVFTTTWLLNLNIIPRTYIVEGTSQLSKVAVWTLYAVSLLPLLGVGL